MLDAFDTIKQTSNTFPIYFPNINTPILITYQGWKPQSLYVVPNLNASAEIIARNKGLRFPPMELNLVARIDHLSFII